MQAIGFDNNKYLRMQSEKIRERISQFGGKLYLEFGGKLFDDYHASRVLPGFAPDSKVRMLMEMRDEAEIIIAISADDIERSKRRGDLGITYDDDTLRLIDAFQGCGLYVGSVVITHYRGQTAAEKFQHRLEALGIRVRHRAHCQRRRLRPQRLHRDDAQPHRRDRTRPRQRQDGHLPEPALPRAQARRVRGLRQV